MAPSCVNTVGSFTIIFVFIFLILVVIMVVSARNEAQISEEREQPDGNFHGIEAMFPYLTVNHHVSVVFRELSSLTIICLSVSFLEQCMFVV